MMLCNLTRAANFRAAEVTVWTHGSCQAISPMAWERDYQPMGVEGKFYEAQHTSCRFTSNQLLWDAAYLHSDQWV